MSRPSLGQCARAVRALLLVAIGAQAGVVRAQDQSAGTTRLIAERLAAGERIEVDGHLQEPAWARAAVAGGFRQQDPQPGSPATEPTEIRVLYDAQRIVIGARCLDSEPTRILANQMQRDQSLGSDDRLMIALDTYLDGRSGYYFEVNPAGAMGDGLIVPGNGLSGLSQGLGLDVLPYVRSTVGDAPARGERRQIHAAVGLDAAYNVTPALRLNLSINTDFAETEVDQRQVNLTRFPLFFPEKRSFFLEGAGLFDFARETGNSLLPFFSRRIGLDANGSPQAVDAGAKITGHAGAFDVGVLFARTRTEAGTEGESIAVGRVRRRLWRQSYVGGIATFRDGASTVRRETTGVDFLLASSRFGRQLVEYSGFLLAATRPGRAGPALAYGTRLSLPNDPLTAWVAYRAVDSDFDPAVGFVDRRGYRLLNPDVRYTFHINNRMVRRDSLEGTLNVYFDRNGRVESRLADLQLVRLQFQSEDIVEYHLRPQYERLPQPFTISTGIRLAAGGQYSAVRSRVQGQSASRRRVSASALYETGGFYSGHRTQTTASVSVRPRRGWLLSAGADINRVTLAEGRFTTRVWTSDVNVQLDPFTSFVSRMQFDSVSRQLGWQARFRWISAPGNDLYVVYSGNWMDQDSLRPLDRRLALKLVRAVRF